MRSHYERKRDSSVHCETNLKRILASPWNYEGIEGEVENLTTSLRYTLGLIMNHIAAQEREELLEDRKQAEQYSRMKALFTWKISRPLEMSTEIPYSLIFNNHHLQIHPDTLRNKNVQ